MRTKPNKKSPALRGGGKVLGPQTRIVFGIFPNVTVEPCTFMPFTLVAAIRDTPLDFPWAVTANPRQASELLKQARKTLRTAP